MLWRGQTAWLAAAVLFFININLPLAFSAVEPQHLMRWCPFALARVRPSSLTYCEPWWESFRPPPHTDWRTHPRTYCYWAAEIYFSCFYLLLQLIIIGVKIDQEDQSDNNPAIWWQSAICRATAHYFACDNSNSSSSSVWKDWRSNNCTTLLAVNPPNVVWVY